MGRNFSIARFVAKGGLFGSIFGAIASSVLLALIGVVQNDIPTEIFAYLFICAVGGTFSGAPLGALAGVTTAGWIAWSGREAQPASSAVRGSVAGTLVFAIGLLLTRQYAVRLLKDELVQAVGLGTVIAGAAFGFLFDGRIEDRQE